MNPGIFLISDNEELVEMNERQYDSDMREQIGFHAEDFEL
jgi:hypothetical protein